MKNSDLQKFLIDSNSAGYAGGEEKKWIKESNGSTTIPFEKGDWRSNDNFYGGEPYGGRLVAFYKNKPVWIMVYYGWVDEKADTNKVYSILRNALKNMPEEAPFRGPKELIENDMKYENSWNGNIERYFGEEKIFQGDNLLYKANYMGGLVDNRDGV